MPAADFAAILQALQEVANKLDDVQAALKKQGGGGGGGGSGFGGGGGLAGRGRGAGARGAGRGAGAAAGRGIAGRAAGLALRAGVAGVAAGAAAAGTAVAAIGVRAGAAGLLDSSRGGSFGAGFARSLNQVVAKIPFIGEYAGNAPLERTLQGTEGDLNSATNTVARILGPGGIDSRTRGFLANKLGVENRNVELDRQANSVITNQIAPLAAQGLGRGAEAIAIGQQMNHMLGMAGLQQNQ